MQTIDFSGMIVVYNFCIGVLVMSSSEKLGAIAGGVSKTYGTSVARYVRVSTFTFGACVATLMAMIYLLVFMLKIGV